MYISNSQNLFAIMDYIIIDKFCIDHLHRASELCYAAFSICLCLPQIYLHPPGNVA